jgi:hypothetical protein
MSKKAKNLLKLNIQFKVEKLCKRKNPFLNQHLQEYQYKDFFIHYQLESIN